jgi:hypothetical protein
MLRGDFESAWQATDRIELPRREMERGGGFIRGDHHLVWDGSEFLGKRVLVRCEHGLGDTIQFLRYLPRLRRRASYVIAKVQPALLRLVTGMPSIDLLRDAWTTDPDPPHDVAIECMELPYAFRDTPATLPARVPYLPIDQIRAAARPLSFPGGVGLRVGLIWAASDWNPLRSIPLAALAPLALIEGVRFFSLQQGPQATDIAVAPFPIVPLSEQTKEVDDAAAAMLEMDVIITVDGMPAHLAGALGRPVWVLLQHEADWRWMQDRVDSPWYPTMRLFRQPRPGGWAEVALEVARELRWWMGRDQEDRSAESRATPWLPDRADSQV